MQTTATGLLFLIACYWTIWGVGRVWRRYLWSRVHEELRVVSSELGAPIRPYRFGWRVKSGRSEFRVRGGVLGVQTRMTAHGEGEWTEGLPSAEEVSTWLRTTALPSP